MPVTEHPAFDPPGDEHVIWRYMDLAKYVSLLHHRALFFSSADRLGDPFEGSYPLANAPARDRLYGPDENLHLSLERRRLLRATLVSCWHLGQFESAAMWRLYAFGAIAIRSTVGSFRNALKETPRAIHLGAINYIDYEAATISEENLLRPFLYKRLSFAYEHELRAVALSPQYLRRAGPVAMWPETGEYVPAVLHELIEAVHVAPSSANWYVEAVRSVTSRYDVSAQVIRSKLDEAPFY